MYLATTICSKTPQVPDPGLPPINSVPVGKATTLPDKIPISSRIGKSLELEDLWRRLCETQ